MERALPVIEIVGTKFLLDVNFRELRQVGKPQNRIYFSRMKHHETHYSFHFDSITKTTASAKDKNVVEIVLPPMAELDPVGMAAKYNVPEISLIGKTDWEVMADKQYIESRLKGDLPVIDLAGHPYIIDNNKHELRWTMDENKRIDLTDLPMLDDGERYAFCFRPATQEVVNLDNSITRLPKGVLALEIPTDLGLDPIGFCSLMGVGYQTWIKIHPPDKNLRARVVPWEELGFPALVQKNRALLEQQKQGNAKKSKRNKRKGL